MTPSRNEQLNPAGVSAEVAYVREAATSGALLGEIHYGARPVTPGAVVHPLAWVGMPLLSAGAQVELWTSAQPVVSERIGPLTFARNRELLFGCFAVDSPADFNEFEARTQEGYARLLTLVEAEGYPHLLRVWNYFPDIGERVGHLDRYMVFCRGRHQALAAHYRDLSGRLPAASAVGSRHGGLVIYFLAGKTPGRHRENPRQMSAYCYPPQYGPRSPSFARATLVRSGGREVLHISGTASIVGHESRHIGDPGAQLEETLANLRALIDSTATEETVRFDGLASLTRVKVYIRRPEDYPLIRARLEQVLAPDAQCLYLEAEVCRPELLLEIEAIAESAR